MSRAKQWQADTYGCSRGARRNFTSGRLVAAGFETASPTTAAAGLTAGAAADEPIGVGTSRTGADAVAANKLAQQLDGGRRLPTSPEMKRTASGWRRTQLHREQLKRPLFLFLAKKKRMQGQRQRQRHTPEERTDASSLTAVCPLSRYAYCLHAMIWLLLFLSM